jgi:hypothetical protein
MKRMKPHTEKYWEIFPHISTDKGRFVYIDTRTGNVRKRWWTKARVPGEVRASRLPGGSGYRPVKYGAKKLRTA